MAINKYRKPIMGLRWTDGNQTVEFEAHGDAVAIVCLTALACFTLYAVTRAT